MKIFYKLLAHGPKGDGRLAIVAIAGILAAILVIASIFGTVGTVIEVSGVLGVELTAIGEGPPLDLLMHFSM